MLPVLNQLERATNLATLAPQMLSGTYQGKLLEFISRMIAPNRILEIGTFTGYAAICLAQGLGVGGKIHTIEVNDELGWIIRNHVAMAGLTDQFVLHLGDAAAVIPTLDETFDLIFLDAGKMEYHLHYEMCLPLLRSGGYMLIDNVLWDGKVVSEVEDKDPTTLALRDFNHMVHQDHRVENILLPIRDGIMLLRKIP